MSRPDIVGVTSAAMCAACVAQGAVYVGGALTGLQVMAMRASARRRRSEAPDAASDPVPTDAEPARDGESQARAATATV
jgi:hypothetical protein